MFEWWNRLPVYAPETGAGSGTSASPDPAPDPAPAEGPTAQDFLDFDPFTPPAEPGTQPGQGGAGTPAPRSAETPPAPGDESSPASDPGQSPQTEPDPVQTQLAAITELLRQSRAQPAPAPQPAPAGPQGPRFSFTVPPAITAALQSEDPAERSEGFNTFANGLANSIYAEVKREFDAERTKILEAIPQLTQQGVSLREQQREMHDDFYNRFSDLPQTPEFKRLVALTAQQMAAEQVQAGQPWLGWGTEFREKLGKRIYNAFGREPPPLGGGKPAPAGNGKRPAAKPQFATGAGARASAPQAPNEAVKDLWDTMDY